MITRGGILNLDRLFDPPSELEAARERRAQALARVQDAKDRRDTRDLHAAQRDAKAATTTVIRLEGWA